MERTDPSQKAVIPFDERESSAMRLVGIRLDQLSDKYLRRKQEV